MSFPNIGILVVERKGQYFPLGMVRSCLTDETESKLKYLVDFGDLQEEESYLKWLELVISYGIIELEGREVSPWVGPIDFSIYKNKKVVLEVKDCHTSPLPLTIDQIQDLNFIELEFVKEKDNATP